MALPGPKPAQYWRYADLDQLRTALVAASAIAYTTDASGLSLLNNNDTRWNFDAITTDPLGMITNHGGGSTTWTCTVPTAGTYHVSAIVSCASASSCDVAPAIWHNGASYAQAVARLTVGGANYVAVPVSADIVCAVADTVWITCYQNSGGTVGGNASPTHNRFAIHRIAGG